MIANDERGWPHQNDHVDSKAGCLNIYGERKVKRILICLILTALFAGAVVAQDVSVRSDHPDEYVVQEGDTLWDISGRFLDYPWQWPAIWHANQQIENPHLIYPGDVISLVYLDGQPRLMVDRGKPTVRLSPEARITSREAVTAIPKEDIAGFIRNIRMVSPEAFDALPYVVANEEQRRVSTDKDRTYVRGMSGNLGDHFAIVRLGHIYYWDDDEKRVGIDPGHGSHVPSDSEYRVSQKFRMTKRGEVIGFELFQVAEGELIKQGDPAILEVVGVMDTVIEGDLIMPLDDIGYPDHFMPHAMDVVPDGLRVVAVQGDNRLVGHQKIVSISGGTRQGVEPGVVFSAFRAGALVRDDVKYPKHGWADVTTWSQDKVALPDEFNAYIMVFRAFDEISYALVMEGAKEVRVDDILRHPDETL
jgi:hypothetical protein